MGFFDRISEGLSRSRDKFKESMNVLLDRGPDLDEEFWEGLEETLILSDVGGAAASDIVENLRDPQGAARRLCGARPLERRDRRCLHGARGRHLRRR